MVLLPLWFFLGSLFIIGLGIAVAVLGRGPDPLRSRSPPWR